MLQHYLLKTIIYSSNNHYYLFLNKVTQYMGFTIVAEN